MTVDERTEGAILTAPGPVALVTISNARKRNAMSQKMWAELTRTLRALDADRSVRSIVITGGSDFCAGADISEFPRGSRPTEDGSFEQGVRVLRETSKPVIAAISGYCLGGGMGLALACDFRIADRSIKFGIPAARLGIVYGWTECQQLCAVVGLVEAKRILFSGRRFDAQGAERIGFAEISETGALEAAWELARSFADCAPLSIAGMKLALQSLAASRAPENVGRLVAAQQAALESRDHQEGVAAFNEKRKPGFIGE